MVVLAMKPKSDIFTGVAQLGVLLQEAVLVSWVEVQGVDDLVVDPEEVGLEEQKVVVLVVGLLHQVVCLARLEADVEVALELVCCCCSLELMHRWSWSCNFDVKHFLKSVTTTYEESLLETALFVTF